MARTRRRAMRAAPMLLAPPAVWAKPPATPPALPHPQRRWIDLAEAMRQRALGWGDQPYGAMVVTATGVVAEGPNRVVKNANPDAHAERVAIAQAQRLLGTADRRGAVLCSTSRRCRLCEQAAARAGMSRMCFDPQGEDAGAPRGSEGAAARAACRRRRWVQLSSATKRRTSATKARSPLACTRAASGCGTPSSKLTLNAGASPSARRRPGPASGRCVAKWRPRTPCSVPGLTRWPARASAGRSDSASG